jgi:hypothetical protein
MKSIKRMRSRERGVKSVGCRSILITKKLHLFQIGSRNWLSSDRYWTIREGKNKKAIVEILWPFSVAGPGFEPGTSGL